MPTKRRASKRKRWTCGHNKYVAAECTSRPSTVERRQYENFTRPTKVKVLRRFDPLPPLNVRSATVHESRCLGMRQLGFEGSEVLRWPP